MKKILSLMMSLMSVLSVQAEPVTIWENSQGWNPGWWDKVSIDASKFENAKVGDMLVLTLKTDADWGCYITLGSVDGSVKYYESNDADPSQAGILGNGLGASPKDEFQDVNVAIVPKFLPLLKEKGLSIGGGAYVLTKVRIEAASVNEAIVPHSPKLKTGYANPLVDHKFIADPTSIEYNGRLYVYGTNDSQQYPYDISGYDKIKSLCMISTDDMANWTYHGDIPVGDIMTSCGSSWAPSIVSREEADGETHFYLYYAHNGGGFNVLTATSPVGPWTAPLGNNKPLDDGSTFGCSFDPGAVIDDQGQGWVAVGGGQGRIIKLNDDMISFSMENVIDPKPQYHMEANEMNFIGGKYVYTYNTNWESPYPDWTLSEEHPSQCSMVYMVSDNPMDENSWAAGYGNDYLQNPGMFGFRWGNNHTHLQKFAGKWYIIYHTGMLNDDSWDAPADAEIPGMGTQFRSLMIDEIKVDEQKVHIYSGRMTKKGVKQIKFLDPYIIQQAETTAATEGVAFESGQEIGNMIVKPGKAFTRHGMPEKSLILVRKANFGTGSTNFSARLRGEGSLTISLDSPDEQSIATISVNNGEWADLEVPCEVSGSHNLVFTLQGNIEIDYWKFTENATGIERNENTTQDNESPAYNLAGMSINADSEHGVIIQNGKKYLK